MIDLTLTASGIIEALTYSPRVDVKPILAEHCRQDDLLMKRIARAAGAIHDAGYSGQFYGHSISADDFRALADFVEFASHEFRLAGVGALRAAERDEQHSPDGYSHYRDLEQM